MQTRARELWDAFTQAAHHIVQRQQGCAPELHDDGLFGRGKHRALGLSRAHWRVCRRGATSPLRDGRATQSITLGQDAGLFFRRLELGTNSRRCTGAAMKNICHNVSCSSLDRITSRLSGTAHLRPSRSCRRCSGPPPQRPSARWSSSPPRSVTRTRVRHMRARSLSSAPGVRHMDCTTWPASSRSIWQPTSSKCSSVYQHPRSSSLWPHYTWCSTGW